MKAILASQILAHHRANRLVKGLEADDSFLRGLQVFALSSYQVKFRAAYLKGVIDECKSQALSLVDMADTPDKRVEVLPMVNALYMQASDGERELKELVND